MVAFPTVFCSFAGTMPHCGNEELSGYLSMCFSILGQLNSWNGAAESGHKVSNLRPPKVSKWIKNIHPITFRAKKKQNIGSVKEQAKIIWDLYQ
jgi:hypothetical protein